MTNQRTCMILAGGLGTRLRAVVSDVPKPMAMVEGRPFLEYLVAQARAGGCGHVVMCVSHLASLITSHFGDGSRFGLKIEYSVEQTPLGTGGAIALAMPLVRGDRFFVLNGDSYCPLALQEIEQTHVNKKAAATLAVCAVEDAARFGTVEVCDDAQVRSFREKGQAPGRQLVNAGIYVLNRDALATVPRDKPCSLEREVFPALVGRGLYAHQVKGPFLDIGTPESFAAAQTQLRDIYLR